MYLFKSNTKTDIVFKRILIDSKDSFQPFDKSIL